MTIHFHETFPLPPSTNAVYRHRAVGKRSMMYMTKAGQDYKTAVREVCRLRGVSPFVGPVVVTLAVYFDRRGGDVANREKLLLDALQGLVYQDDVQVVDLRLLKFLDHTHPRVEVTVRAAMGYREGCDCAKCTKKMGGGND